MTTKGIVGVAENYGLITPENITSFFEKSSAREIEKVDADFRDALDYCASQNIPAAEFNYLASASFRAEQGCSVPECRARRMAEPARFSLLYAEKVIFPFYMPKQPEPRWLNGNLRILSEIRPLVDIGVIVPTESQVCLCKSCGNRFTPIHQQVQDAAWEAADRIKVRYVGTTFRNSNYRKKKKKNEWEFQLTFPADFDPDTPNVLFVWKLHPSLERFVQKKGSEGTELPVELIRESGILMRYFRHASEDFLLQDTYRRESGCVYLSDSQREIKMLEQLLGANANPEESRNAMLAAMSHTVPLFSDIQLETLVSVRQQDGDAFAAYRAALNEATREASEKGITPERSKEIYSDIIFPRVAALERKHNVLRSRLRGDTLIEFGVPIAALLVGALSGLNHSVYGNLLQIAGGAELIRSAGQHVKELRHSGSDSEAVKTDPLYFLLKMKRAHERNCANESRTRDLV